MEEMFMEISSYDFKVILILYYEDMCYVSDRCNSCLVDITFSFGKQTKIENIKFSKIVYSVPCAIKTTMVKSPIYNVLSVAILRS